MTETLSARQRETLAALAALIAPGDTALPSSTAIDLTTRPVDGALRSRPDLIGPLAKLLDEAEHQDAASALRTLQHHHPGQFEVLLQVVLGAYFMSPAVWDRLGYSGQEARPLPRAGFGAEQLVAEMMRTPKRFRRPPDFAGEDS